MNFDGEPQRLDIYLQELYPKYSRSRLQEWIKKGRVLVDGKVQKASHILRGGEAIEVEPLELKALKARPEDLPLEALYEDDDVVAIHKPAGMTVHAGAGTTDGTLVNALLHRFEKLSQLGGDLRPGIVHRLDKYTSGVILVAKNDVSHRKLQDQFAGREVEKTYIALVENVMSHDAGTVNRPISRDPWKPVRMAAVVKDDPELGRDAITHWKVLKRYQKYTLVEVKIGTGRTHQIRVHLGHLGHKVAGDTLYGARPHESGRFFLHAWRIRFTQPTTGERIEIEAELAPELKEWLRGLQ
ncbi:MAG: RluA family pseudouridine synthase [Acidobacteria bacterium]|nr:RluA family pseudouridine synthase [Acidobacteriota bacterium]